MWKPLKVYKIPETTIMRLSIYSRYLDQLMHNKIKTVSSAKIASHVGMSSAQVRRDLAYFGEFGTRGIGYEVKELYGHLMSILGLNRPVNIIIIAGAGKLGSALALYQGFVDRGFSIKAIVDDDPDKIGTRLNGLEIESVKVATERIKQYNITIGVVTVPESVAQQVTDILVEGGVKAILNFSPRVLKVPSHIVLRNVDLLVSFDVLSFNMAH